MRPSTKLVLLLALAAIAATGCSEAAAPMAPAATQEAERPRVLESIEAKGLDVLGEFEAPGGMRGFAGMAAQQPVAVYVTPDGGHAVIGMMVDEHGADVGEVALKRLVAAPMSERIWSRLESSRWVADGDAGAPRVVYVFSDPNCPYCNRLWHVARPWVESGKVQLRHVLVGVIREDSANKVAAILADPAPAEALARNERTYADGGIEGAAAVPADVRAHLDANQQLMLELGFQGTPGIVFRDAEGLVQRRSGLPADDDLEGVLGPR